MDKGEYAHVTSDRGVFCHFGEQESEDFSGCKTPDPTLLLVLFSLLPFLCWGSEFT